MLIRRLEVSDLEALAHLHVACWKETYPGMIPQSYLDNMSVEKQLNMYKNTNIVDYTYVVESKGKLLGFTTAARRRDKDLDRMDYGEVQAIYVLKDYQKMGLGGMLMDYATAALEQSHFKYIVLWVLDTNENAIGFYQSQGFEMDGKEQEMTIDGEIVKEVRMVKKIHHYIVEEEED